MLNFCAFPNIEGLVSICTGELLSLASNMYLLVLTIVAIVFSRSQKKFTSRWSIHTMSWVLIIFNSMSILASSTAWLIIAKSETVVIFQILNLLTIFCLPLCFHLYERSFHTKYILTLSFYCLISATSKMLVVTSFSRQFLQWHWVDGVDVRFICAIIQAITLFLLTFITIYNFWKHFKKDFTQLPSQDVQNIPLRFLSKTFFLWCWEILVKGRNKTLHTSDCACNVPDIDFTKPVTVKAPSLLQLLLKQHFKSLLLSGFLLLIVLMLEFVPVYIVYGLIKNFASQQEVHKGLFTVADITKNSYSLATLFLLSECLRCVLYQKQSYIMAGVAAKAQIFLQGLLYDKVSVLAQWELGNNLTDLLTVDVENVSGGLQLLHQLWKTPIQFTMCLVFMDMLIGFSALLPVAIVILLVLLTAWIIHCRAHLETQLLANKQPWYYLIKEFTEHIWILKIKNWQNIFKEKIIEKGGAISERNVMLLFTLIQVIKHTLPTLLLISLFALFDVVKNGEIILSPHAGACTILLLNMLRNQLTLAPTICKHILNMANSLADITSCLDKDEVEASKLEEENHYTVDSCEVTGAIVNGTFTWGTERMAPKILTDINLQIPKGKLTLIIGKAGSGKSSLVSALLSEMNCIVGEVAWTGDKDIAVAAQHPVIFGGTVQENVLFGNKYDAERYLKVITLCNLKDHTVSINESKTNSFHPISLARALYSPAGTLMFDDPLAGLDPGYRRPFFFESILVYAGEERRTVVMTTTDPGLVEHAHQVIVLEEGKIVFAGKPEDAKDLAILAELATTQAPSLPPPLPHRRRFENKTREPEDQIHIKNIPASAYKEWLNSCSGLKLAISLIVLSCTAFLSAIMYWLLLSWIARNNPPPLDIPDNPNIAHSPTYLAKSQRYNTTQNHFDFTTATMYQFMFAGGGVVLLQVFTVVLVNSVVDSACCTLLHDMLLSISSMWLHLYNKTPLSAMVNRFTVDLEFIGRPLMDCLGAVLFLVAEILAALIVQAIVSPGSLTAVIPLSLLIVWFYMFYSPSARILRILQTDFKQNLYKHVSETISCLTLIRGYGVQERYKAALERQTRNLYNINTVSAGVVRWLSLYQDITVNLVMFGCFIATVFVSDKLKIEMSGLALLLLLLSSHHFRLLWNLVDSCDVLLTSIDSCTSFANHTPAERETPRFKPPADWPHNGALAMEDVFASMEEDQEPVLRNITFNVTPGTKLGVGSVQSGGKSYIVPLLFRSMHLHNGSVKIDDWDTSALSLEDLRKSIGFIPANPPLFVGSIRFNMDPTKQYNDDEIWSVLERVSLHDTIADLPNTLESEAYEFSRDTKRLLYLAKMLLKQHSLVVIEEPKIVANTQLHDNFFKVVDRELSTATRLIIAQRSVTLLSCDQILFLHQGRVGSFGTIAQLRENDCPYFRQMNRTSRFFSSVSSPTP